MGTLDALNINQKLDLLVANKAKYNDFKNKCLEIKMVKVFNYLIGKQEPFFRQVQSNKLYRIIKSNKSCYVRDQLEILINSNDEYLMHPKAIAKEIIEDQEKMNKLKFVVF